MADLGGFTTHHVNSMEAHVKLPEIDWEKFGDVHKLHDEVTVLRATVAGKDEELEVWIMIFRSVCTAFPLSTYSY